MSLKADYPVVPVDKNWNFAFRMAKMIQFLVFWIVLKLDNFDIKNEASTFQKRTSQEQWGSYQDIWAF